MTLNLKVMAWNIAEGSFDRQLPYHGALPRIADQIRAMSPDIVLLNEVHNRTGPLGDGINQVKNATLAVRRTLTRSGGRLLLGEPKTKKSRRTIYLTETAVSALREHLSRQVEEIERLGDLYSDDGLVFTSEVGTLVNPSNLRQRSFARLLKRGGLPTVRFHDLRHTCATLLFNRGVHPKHVQELLGHATVAITLDIYSHVIPGIGGQTARAMDDALS